MPLLQDELKMVEQQMADFNKSHPRLNSLDNAIGSSENYAFFTGIVIVFLITAIVRWIFYHFPTWYELLVIGALSYIPGAIVSTIFSGFIQGKYKSYFFKKYTTDETTYNALIKRRTDLRTEKRDLETRIKKLKEYNLKSNLNDFIDELKRNKVSYTDAKTQQQLLEEEWKAVRKNGLFYHTGRYYTNRLVTITGLLRELQSRENIDLVPPLTDPKTKEAVEKKEVKPNVISTPPPNIERKAPDIEKKIETAIKIIPPANKPKPTPKEEEKTTSELFSTSTANIEKQESTKQHPPVKIDFPKLNAHRHNIGELGEQYVFEKEQNNLISQGKTKQSKELIHVSLTNDSEGYDIISFTDTGDRKYIEVKTTTGNEYEPFYMSNTEMEAMNRLNNYWIYRVYNFNIDQKKGDLYKIDCKKELDPYYIIESSSFKVTPKRKTN